MINFNEIKKPSPNAFINDLLQAVKEKNSESLKSLLRKSSLHNRDCKGFNAANYLGMEGDEEQCNFLIPYGARPTDIVSGAIFANKLSFSHKYSSTCDPSLIDMWTWAIFAARSGNQNNIEIFLDKLPKDKRDYNMLARWAAFDGYQKIAEAFLAELPEDKRQYNLVAGEAARGGHQKIAEAFLAELPEDKRNYNLVATGAASGGHQEIAQTFLDKLPEDKRDYKLVAEVAERKGHQKIAETFQSKLKNRMSNSVSRLSVQNLIHNNQLPPILNLAPMNVRPPLNALANNQMPSFYQYSRPANVEQLAKENEQLKKDIAKHHLEIQQLKANELKYLMKFQEIEIKMGKMEDKFLQSNQNVDNQTSLKRAHIALSVNNDESSHNKENQHNKRKKT